jgi:hypothetical protein
MLGHRAAFDSRSNEWSATSTGSNGFCFPPSVTGLKPDEYWRAWRLEMATIKIGQGRLANDALIAMSAARRGATVITANERDFARLAEFRAFQRQVAILSCTSGENTKGLSSWFSCEETSAVDPIAQARALAPPQSLVLLQVRSRPAWSESTLRSLLPAQSIGKIGW